MGRCWRTKELRPTACISLFVSKISRMKEACVVEGIIQDINIPKAHLQDLKKYEKIISSNSMIIQLSQKRCKKLSQNSMMNLLVQQLCNDKKTVLDSNRKPGLDIEFMGYDKYSVKTHLGHLNVSGKEIEVSCSW